MRGVKNRSRELVNPNQENASVLTGERTLTFAHSPDPDDAFMFYGFETGAVTIPGYHLNHHLEDIQTLNERAFRKEFEITAVSVHAYAHLWKEYWVLSCGASVGRRYGPMLIRKKGATATAGKPLRVGIPGKWTTANLVFDLYAAESKMNAEKKIVPFDQIMDALNRGEIDLGLIIHEGQLTYDAMGFEKIWDSGIWWNDKTGLPLPLGLDVVRADVGMELAKTISRSFRQSIEYAQAHLDDAVQYAMKFGRGLDTDLAKRFISMYVNRDTLDQGPEVQAALEKLYTLAAERKLIPEKPTFNYI